MRGFYEIVTTRRSNYRLGARPMVKPGRVEELLHRAIEHSPSAFHSQPGRAIALFGAHHARLWALTWEALRQGVPPENRAGTEAKLEGFAAGLGTILFFIDDRVTGNLEERFPLYAANFAPWAEQAMGNLQYIVWCALHRDGLGVNLQHYNPLIDGAVRENWNVPEDWRLCGQMVFGSPEAPPAPKTRTDTTGMVRLYQ